MPVRPALVVVLLALLARPGAAATLSPEEARNHVGETATVCGTVASAHFSAKSRTQPTFLNFAKPYPNAPFSAVIFGADRAKFGTPEMALNGKRICVSGTIRLYQGNPEIVLDDPSQVTTQP
jgi:hypothetical protein